MPLIWQSASNWLHQSASNCESRYPLRTQIYVDDILLGAHSIEEVVHKRDELTYVLKSASFSLRKWKIGFEFFKILLWNASLDILFFKSSPAPDFTAVTKRSVLSQIATLFDPVGRLVPKIMALRFLCNKFVIQVSRICHPILK